VNITRSKKRPKEASEPQPKSPKDTQEESEADETDNVLVFSAPEEAPVQSMLDLLIPL
jgi:hypothetical protein